MAEMSHLFPAYERDGLIAWGRGANEVVDDDRVNATLMAVERDFVGDCRYFDLVLVRPPDESPAGCRVLFRAHTRELIMWDVQRYGWWCRIDALVALTLAHRVEDGLPEMAADLG